MLDFAHGLVLRAVDKSPRDDHDSPALDDLLACDIVRRSETGLIVTDLGREILSRSQPSRHDRWTLRVLAAAAFVLALTTIAGWVH